LAGRIRRDTGHPPPVIGTLLAATALDEGLYLVTRNARDVEPTGAAVFNPWADDPAWFRLTGA
jgi:predicted nucleic acid-binding protein